METVTPEEVGFSSERLNRIRPVMQAYVDHKKLPGLITLVARRGKVVHFEQVGRMDIEADKPMQADTIFRIFSMTKPITTVAAMMLYEEGHFQLNDPVSKFIPAFKEAKVAKDTVGGAPDLVDLKREITIRDLMIHTSGLQQYGFLKEKTLQENVQDLVKMPLVEQPGTVWRYGPSTNVLAHLVEVIADTSFDAFLKQRIFEPLNMTDTSFYVPSEKMDRFAALYSLAESGKLEITEHPATGDYSELPRCLSGNGGLVSTAADYLQFAQMLLNGGELDGIRLLGPKTLKLMTTNHLADHLMPIRVPAGVVLYGYGFGLGFSIIMSATETQVLEPVGNYGWVGIASTHFWIDPKEEVIGLVLTQFLPISYPLEQQLKVLVYQALVD